MNNYTIQKTKWEKRLKAGTAGHCFDPELLAAGKFCMHITDEGGGDCGSYVEDTAYFDSAQHCLGYIRFTELPRILDMAVGPNQEEYRVADAYLAVCPPGLKEQVDLLSGLLDRSLLSGVVSATELGRIRDEFNTAFAETNPSVQIKCWGSLPDTLSDEYFGESFEEDLEEEIDVDDKPSTQLKKLLDSGKFDESKSTDIGLARKFFERRFSA